MQVSEITEMQRDLNARIQQILPGLIRHLKVPISHSQIKIEIIIFNQEFNQNVNLASQNLMGIPHFGFEILFRKNLEKGILLQVRIPDYIYQLIAKTYQQIFLKTIIAHELLHWHSWKKTPNGAYVPNCQGPVWDFINHFYLDALKDVVVFRNTPTPYLKSFRTYKTLEWMLVEARNRSQLFSAIENGQKMHFTCDWKVLPILFVPQLRNNFIEGFHAPILQQYEATLTAKILQNQFNRGLKLLDALFEKTRQTQSYSRNIHESLLPIYKLFNGLPKLRGDLIMDVDFSDLKDLHL